MKLAIASGKGGTGKTTLSVALAQVADRPVQLLDCDVEEPNSHLFFEQAATDCEIVTVPVPRIDEQRCQHCGACGEFCAFNALACLPTETVLFEGLCHSCGGCRLVCPHDAISEQQQRIGVIRKARHGKIDLFSGVLDVGLAMSPPLIRALKRHQNDETLILLDCPPGTSCPLSTTIQDADMVLLITEPTPFGLHDLEIAVETVRQLKRPIAVIINRSDLGDNSVTNYCRRERIPVLLQLPYEKRVAVAYSRGEGLLDALPGLETQLEIVLQHAEKLYRESLS
ncbi:4Fe-4S binding protein [Desulfuromonas acetoxidans]|uniref:Cobyrinic acid a,c-diamide synthase n=1 Tax=Desulfuromonas acetoxidans (strain DSM 684 / 11070) TaxID=281689 RepID=Q1JWI0_DESA6|nr:ATP-binding protein [Desulfuromonas acetoxidans]EAT14588.1 Cobyrinic acid a,c-diamide synthase [Desulfuromonas acetoxidans DSM 684]MBF0646268.1 ATP-binding protein [Desulfuromonas acetoxidans]NVD25732.1 4Fe-4S binding protein [Desulfuromonas acetoxidans]NVE17028.1 4Fe-4S binding protein [Desulfuromonas acetoxidans]